VEVMAKFRSFFAVAKDTIGLLPSFPGDEKRTPPLGPFTKKQNRFHTRPLKLRPRFERPNGAISQDMRKLISISNFEWMICTLREAVKQE
jgi:hypothetical protein